MSQLKGGGWSKIIGVTSKKVAKTSRCICSLSAIKLPGLAVVSAEPKEFTVVNIVGPINLEKLTQLEGSFGVPYLTLPSDKKKTDK
jgi:hypothetical protein